MSETVVTKLTNAAGAVSESIHRSPSLIPAAAILALFLVVTP